MCARHATSLNRGGTLRSATPAPIPCQGGVGYPIRPFPGSPTRVTALLCLCACPDADTAHRIADGLVEERLAACVQILPGATSVYRWQGKLERASETLLSIKTTRDRLDTLTARVVELHPYELPEVVAVEITGGLPAYLDWIARETAPGDHA